VVYATYSDPINKARLNAVTSPHAGNWLSTIPVTACGLDLSKEAIRVAIGLRLGNPSGHWTASWSCVVMLDLCAPHQCQCGETADQRGHHGLVCRRSAGRTARHFAVNDIVWSRVTIFLLAHSGTIAEPRDWGQPHGHPELS